MPSVIIGLCGPNGSGKSTTYTGLLKEGSLEQLPWVNADSILVKMQTAPTLPLAEFGLHDVGPEEFNSAAERHSMADRIVADGHTISLIAFGEPTQLLVDEHVTGYEAALASAVVRDLLIDRGISFAFETVMSHPSKIELFKVARAAGFNTHMYFVCTSDPDLNVERVANRVSEGGHDVPEKKIRSRYTSAISLLPLAAERCDVVSLIDTTDSTFRIVAEKSEGIWKTYPPIPKWAAGALPAEP